MLSQLFTRQEAKCAPAVEPPLSITPSHGEGFTGAPGIELHGPADQWAAAFTLKRVEQSQDRLELHSEDDSRGLTLIHTITLDEYAQLATFQSHIKNAGDADITLAWLSAATVPIADGMTRLKAFEGRWSAEFQTQDHDLFMGSYVRENRRGKTSHDTFPGFITCAPFTSELQGECYGFHLGSSGNHRTRVELMADGRAYAQLGELLLPGEVTLTSGDSYTSPVLYVGYSHAGFGHLSRQFHHYIRANVLSHTPDVKPRPVHYNTWEGIYFDHDPATLKALADSVAPLGVERFVLDDGWFKGRRADNAGLGDWQVDKAIYPEGLGPLIEHVTSLGMEFGIWFEPEMVNPDSDLYRAHPEWVLSVDSHPQVPFRNQYVLDLTNSDVVDYLFAQIDDVMNTYPAISYIKWDMNRDINHPGNLAGKPAVHAQTRALYRLLARVRDAHPQLEIESCCSGGGRIDLGILAHTDRFWTSDSNDALDRLEIQRGFSFFFPPEIMGAHVGPRDCHITGRHIPIETRAAVALFGHMGMEMDPRELTGHERNVLARAFALYKQHRSLIHSGDMYRFDEDGLNVCFGIVSQNKSDALYAYNSIKETTRTTPGKFRFHGLAADKSYRLSLIWPEQPAEYSPSVLSVIEGQVFSGEVLLHGGLQLPVLFPQTSLIFHLSEV
ncbi:alpha-galactosidase [Alteromonas halophila]|uniref:alpha-galactosidase n=2 Tax=Alteromonas halophila TaxID=516698 RepID=A0A918JJ20_9ALTE|nr:alpha-galactosidase [Alteromonas halophila]